MNGNGSENGSNGAHNGSNGKSTKGLAKLALGHKPVLTDSAPTSKMVKAETFDQPVILQQTSTWSRGIVWAIVGVTSVVILWASIFKIEEAIPAQGQLKPEGQVQPIQAPVGGVIEEIYVKDGQTVKQGELLAKLDPTAAKAQQQSLEQVRASLQRQNQFYRSQISGATMPTLTEAQQLKLPPEILSLTANRAALISENRLYEAQLNGTTANLTPEQVARVQSGLAESQSRASAAQLDVSQLQEQLNQTISELESGQKTLEIDRKVYADLATLLEEGGIQRLQVTRQQQQVIASQAEVDKLRLERQRLEFAIAQAQQNLANTVALSDTDLRNKMAENDKQLASIESQLNKAIVDNENQISDINSRMSETEVTLKYQELRSPVDGVVFDLQAKGPGFVATTTEPILKVVPSNALVAEVYITNQDIGFLKTGMHVDVRIDSFPFSEFGDIKGKLVNIGSDALPPDQANPYYRFPAKVEMEKQFVSVGGKEVPLQSGMSITTNIITRKRTIMSIFTDMFARKVDSIKTVR
ncbi:MAG: HlyD family efflux transporter periplasmic adaptor subunit [Leptolyngbyaceae cyanobacterium CRU_2_3]|nr:HlyD family efflux transporter periplasmic adaptor subunit [Leptolyngbyaceae cyanobacterium CRU_2_3]